MRMSILGMAVPFVVMAGLVSAQERRAPEDATRAPAAAESRPAAGTARASQSDQEIAAVKLAMCRNEVELAKLASQKAQSDEVKQFAAKMVKEHTEGCAKLEKWAGSAGNAAVGRNPRATAGEFGNAATRPATPDAADRAAQPPVRPGAAAPGTPAPGSPGGARPGADVARQPTASHGLDWVSIHQEMAQQCLASAKQELEKKDGAEFDKCYIGMAIASHQHAVDADHVFMNHSSQAFQGEVEECLKTATSHLNEAKDIMKNLADKKDQGSN
jgi:predicted outer membrane protein